MHTSRLTTSTRTAVIFAVFTGMLLTAFVLVLNAYYFYTWRLDEKEDVTEKMNELILSTSWTENIRRETYTLEEIRKIADEAVKQGGVVIPEVGNPIISPQWNAMKPYFWWLYRYQDKWYTRYTAPVRQIGTVGIPYEVTGHVQEQLSLLRISFLLLAAFFVIVAIVSFFFVRSALRPLSEVVRYIRSFQVQTPLPELPVSGPDNDEFMVVAQALQEAFGKIQSQATVLQRFSTDAAHEFKTPLMVLRSEIDYALKSGEYRLGLENIRGQIGMLDTMISTLLTIARIEKEELQKEPVNMSRLLEEVIAESERIFPEKHVHITKDIREQVALLSDRSMLRIVFSNLVGNAFKYTDTGEIHIHLDPDGFSVRDTGTGIDPENLDKIWDRFYREDASRSTRSGHGLGLFLVKTIAEKLGHTLRAESIKGKGSTFSVRF